MNLLENCSLCPRNCQVNRIEKQSGFCGEDYEIRLARAALHFYEEPVISGVSGSGTVFFSGCNLRCIYCQNREIALGDKGLPVSIHRLVEIFFELKEKGACNINLVTPSHFIPQIAQAISMAKEQGFNLPFVYNTSSYEYAESLKQLEGLIDIYLPDFKYMDPQKALDYSHASDYPQIAKAAIAEMFRQVGDPVFDSENGLMKKGVIVRHMVLPGATKNSKEIVKYLYETYKNTIYISVMNQYTPIMEFKDYPELSRKVTRREYNKVIDYCLELGITNAFIQEGDTAKESFIPPFSFEGVLKNE